MKKQHLNWVALLGAAIGLATFWPGATKGADSAADTKAASLMTELRAQHGTLLANQDKIDQQLTAIDEELRLARIYVSRGGSK